MRGDLVRKLAARGLATGTAVLAFIVVALTGATTWGLGLSLLALAATVWERRVRPGADGVAETTLIAAGVLVGYSRQLDSGFDVALTGTAVILLGLMVLAGPLREAGNLELLAANLPVRTWVPRITARLGDIVAGLLAVLALAAMAGLPATVALAASLLAGAAVGAVAGKLVMRRLRPGAGGSPVTRELRRRQPEFLLYFSAPPARSTRSPCGCRTWSGSVGPSW